MVMASAAAGRSALAATVAAAAYAALVPSETQGFLQLLFLQGGLTALLSASAYTRAAHLAGRDPRYVAGSVRSFGAFVLATTAMVIALGWVVVPTYELDRATHFAVLTLMVLGAAATASNAFLQGLLVGGGATGAAFWPVLVTSALAVVVGLVFNQDVTIVTLTLIWIVPQVVSPVLLATTSQLVLHQLAQAVEAPRARGNYFGATGGVNASSVGVAFVFRERWAASLGSQEAATTFTLVRLTEIAYQLAAMVLSSLPRYTRALSPVLFGSRWRRLAIAVLGTVASLLCLVPALLWDQWSFERLVVAEVLAAPARLIALITAMVLLSRTTTRAYIVGILCTILAALCATWVPAIQASPYGLQAFQAGGTLPIVLCAIVVARRDARRIERQSPPAPS